MVCTAYAVNGMNMAVRRRSGGEPGFRGGEKGRLRLALPSEDEPVDAAQIAMALGVIHAPADDEIRRDVETAISDREVECSGFRLSQQRAEREAGRGAL